MGGQQSKDAAIVAHEKAVLERLRNLSLEDDEEFVEVNSNSEKAVCVPILRQPEGIPVSSLEIWLDNVLKDPKNKLALNTFSSINPKEALKSRATKIADKQVFNVKIPFEGGPITNQRSSGRCWLFAATNVFRIALMKRYNLESFELSQAYLFY